MKLKSYPLLAVLIGFSAQAYAQCTPDQGITTPGFYPEEFATAHKDEAYQHVFQVRIMADTVINFLGEDKTAYVDSIQVDDIRNLPPGFTFDCSDPKCMFTPDKTGCIIVTGNPAAGHVGEYLVDIDMTIWARVDGTIPVIQNETIEDKKLSVSQWPSSTNDLTLLRQVLSPNPSSDGIFTVTGISTVGLTAFVYDISGAKLGEIDVVNGSLDCSGFEGGMYFVKLVSNDGIVGYQKVNIQ